MPEKPGYKEPEQRIEELEKESIKHNQAEEALREGERRFRELADLLPETVYESDAEGSVTFFNRTGSQVFGYTLEDFAEGLDLFELLIPEDRDHAKQNLRKTLFAIRGSPVEYTGVRKDGSTFPITMHANPIMDKDKCVGARGLIIDISERKRAEEERLHREKLQGVLETAGGICHELNQPMHAILGYSELLLTDITEDNTFYKDIRKILEQIVRMGEITKKLMKITRFRTSEYIEDRNILDIYGASNTS